MVGDERPRSSGKSPEQRIAEAKAVLARHSSVGAAAEELGLTYAALRCLFQRAGDTAGHWLAKVPVPEGMRIRAITRGVRGTTTHLDRESDDPPAFVPVPEGHAIKGMSTFVGPQGEVRGQWIKTDQEKQRREALFWAAVAAHAEKYKGLALPTPAPAATMGNLLTVYGLGDPHIGMLAWARETGGESFDTRIAEQDLYRVVDLLVERAPNSKRAVIATVGDTFHADNDSQLTPTNKHKLDCDDRWQKILEIGLSIFRRLIDRALQKHDEVIVVIVPGNHDPQMARVLALLLRTAYENEPRVRVVDNANPFIYLRHGKCLFGFTHGHNVKADALPSIMAVDRPQDWGETEERVWITGHVHHDTRKDFRGCHVMTLRTIAPRDAWTNDMGFRSKQSLWATTYDAEFGEDVRVTVPLRRVREAA